MASFKALSYNSFDHIILNYYNQLRTSWKTHNIFIGALHNQIGLFW